MTIYPQTKFEAGTHYWSVLFNTAAQFPDHPSTSDKQDVNNYIKSTIKRFTCDECIQHAFDYIRRHPIDNDNKESLMKYICKLKNNSNEHEGKDVIDCDSFVLNSLNRDGGCKECQIETIKAPAVTIPALGTVATTAIKPTVISTPTPIKRDPSFMNIWDFEKRYPSLNKRAISFEAKPDLPQQPQSGGMPNMNDMQTKYPSLANFDTDLDDSKHHQEEELDGILKPLDSIYAGPAAALGISASEMNLAYTPEILTNGVSLLTQIYLSNTGGLLTTLVSSLGLLGVSIFAKNGLSHYDRLFIQNTTASMLFHTLNFLNPRIRDELLPELQKLGEGITTMNWDKIKDALLYGHKSESEISDKNTRELLESLETKNGKINMEKLLKGEDPHVAGDLRTIVGSKDKQHSGSITKEELLKMMDNHGMKSSTPSNTNYSVLADVQNKYDYILDNDYL